MNKIPSSLQQKIEERKSNDSLRTLLVAEGMIDFWSNDYLGIAKWQDDQTHSQGATGSRLISGNFKRTEAIESQLADFFGMPSGILFNSGYDANLGLFSSVPLRGDTIIYDELIHASIRDGARMSNANDFAFKHNDPNDLKNKFERASGNIYVAVESVYSMDGDVAPLKEIAALCSEAGAYLIVDEAHSGGLYGDKGEGLCSALSINDQLFAKVITFGKAYGSHGAIVMGHEDLRTYLINFARSLLYTTALPLHAVERILSVVHKGAEASDARERLYQNIAFFKAKMGASEHVLIPSDSAIQSLIVPGNQEAKAIAKRLTDAQLAVKAILHPTVPKGKERLRICLHSFSTEEEITKLTDILNG